MTRIFLIGYMGAGKTTLGKALSRDTGLSFIDLDWYMEERFHKTVACLYSERGEESFRRLEQQMLHEVGEFEDVIVSCGGGTPCFFDNMDYMKKQGITVFLDVRLQVLLRRLRIAKIQRPLIQNKSEEELETFVSDALEKRAPCYSQARYRFNADELEDHTQIKTAVIRLKELIGLQPV